MAENESLWAKALAFEDEYGEHGPTKLRLLLREMDREGRTAEANDLKAMGALLEQYHRSATKGTR